jgi:hypothetical protein
MMTCWGSRLPAVKMISRVRFDASEKRDTAKATIDDSRSVSTTAGIVTMMVFQKNCGMSACVHAAT